MVSQENLRRNNTFLWEEKEGNPKVIRTKARNNLARPVEIIKISVKSNVITSTSMDTIQPSVRTINLVRIM